MALALTKCKPVHIVLLALVLIIILCILIPSKEQRVANANEQILSRFLDIEGIPSHSTHIRGEMITVTIEVSDANEYDAQLVSWWGSIFGYSALLQGHKTSYEQVVIINNVNGEGYAYLAANLVTVDDFAANRIDEATFWDEVLITSSPPQSKDIAAFSGLPQSALSRDRFDSTTYTPKTDRNWSWLRPILALLIVALIVLSTIHQERIKHHSNKLKETVHHHSKHVQKHVRHHTQKAKHVLQGNATKARKKK
jgi:hypothetical protein